MKRITCAASAALVVIVAPAALAQEEGVTHPRRCRLVATDVAKRNSGIAMDDLNRRAPPRTQWLAERRAIQSYWYGQRRDELTAACQAYLAGNPGGTWFPPEK